MKTGVSLQGKKNRLPGDVYMWVWDHKAQDLASRPDILLAPHALLPGVGEERLRDKPKERLCGRLHRIGMNRFLRDLGSGFANLRG